MLRMSEVYLSTQGEGPRVGQRTVFVRFAGCNLRCPGWPCDTQYAIDPKKYRQDWKLQSVAHVFDSIMTLVGDAPTNVCFTGGEPFIQVNTELYQLIDKLASAPYVKTIEAFTNGTQHYEAYVLDNVSLIMDWKLPGSGENPDDPARINNLRNMSTRWQHAVKFVIKDWNDFQRAKSIFHTYRTRFSMVTVFYGVAWGHLENSELVKWVLAEDLPWSLNVQVHNYVWPREERAR
jgi:7-carboxy-7-deazaguanine synthase